MSTLEVNTITPQSGTTVTIGGSGQTVSLGSGATQSGFGGTNTPYFHAYRSDAWNSVPNSTWAKVPLNAEVFDSANAFDTSNYRFTAQTSGKYFIYGSFQQTVSIQGIYTAIYKNGSRVYYTQIDGTFGGIGRVSGLIELNGSSDYVELYVFLDGTAGATMAQDACFLGGYRIIE
tara:strand:+ start:321 stop:845 length:525 start_codon:yes stop_codon:yes gene_type:complete